MSIHNPYTLPLAVRVYPEPKESDWGPSKPKKWRCPRGMFVFDTETRVDATQKLTFGSYRIFWDDKCLEEGLFHGDDLPGKDRRTLEQYVATHQANTNDEHASNLNLHQRCDSRADQRTGSRHCQWKYGSCSYDACRQQRTVHLNCAAVRTRVFSLAQQSACGDTPRLHSGRRERHVSRNHDRSR
jgi:hypothetical protein